MKWLITGGAGFIGSNAAKQCLDRQHQVILLDNLSRPGAEQNLEWIKAQGPVEFVKGDIRNFELLEAIFRKHPDIDVILHLAAQVAVTTSVRAPREDLEINLGGTFNLCEALRHFSPHSILLNASTNKVYGKMEDLNIVKKNNRYTYHDLPKGVSEERPTDFHSPYGCSKGAAEQYVHDYARIYGLKTVNFRQSCIYGTRQFGVEDQGWVAWFAIATTTGRPITIYGDGQQVRDVLWVDDLIDCYFKAVHSIEKTSGQIYNIGGGPGNTLSLLELLSILEEHLGSPIKHSFADWRPGDQPVYVSDIGKAKNDFGWYPSTPKEQGIQTLLHWITGEKKLFQPRESLAALSEKPL